MFLTSSPQIKKFAPQFPWRPLLPDYSERNENLLRRNGGGLKIKLLSSGFKKITTSFLCWATFAQLFRERTCAEMINSSIYSTYLAYFLAFRALLNTFKAKSQRFISLKCTMCALHCCHFIQLPKYSRSIYKSTVYIEGSTKCFVMYKTNRKCINIEFA